MTSRRSFLIGIGAALAAPAIVRADSLMKIAVLRKSLNEATLREALVTHFELYEPWNTDFSRLWGFVLREQGGRLLKFPVYQEDFYAR
jgi:hypothetical protein